MVDIDRFCTEAVRTAAELGVTLNYQPEGIAQMEAIIMPKFSAWLKDGTITADRGAWNLAAIFGIYLGETMLRQFAAEKGFRWGTPEGDFPVLMKDDRNQMSPITKVHKRILNGEEDSIESFYRIAIYFAEGRFEKTRGSQTPGEE